MKDKIIDFETAKLAKEVDFDVKVQSYYGFFTPEVQSKPQLRNPLLHINNYGSDGSDSHICIFNFNDDKLVNTNSFPNCSQDDEFFPCFNEDGTRVVWSAPTQSLLQRWLREIHKIHIICDPADDNEYAFQVGNITYMEWVLNKDEVNEPKYFETYEKGLEVALVKALNKIKDEIR